MVARSKMGNLLILALILLAVYAAETATTHFFGDQTLAPLLSVLACTILVFRNSPNFILFSIPFLAAETYWLITDSSIFPLVRTSTMVVGALLAYWTCRQRVAVQDQLDEVDMILRKVDTPWVLCDRLGNIQRIGSKAAQLIGSQPEDLTGTSFFSRFGGGPSKGELIQKFLKAADSRSSVEHIEFGLTGSSALTFLSSFIPLQTKEGVGILAILQPKSS